MSDGSSLWVVLPAGQQAGGGWIDDTLKQRALEQGLGGGRRGRQRGHRP